MTPVTIGTPVTFFWHNSLEIAGIVANSRLDMTNNTFYYTLALFDPTNTVDEFYPNARNTTDKAVGTFEVLA